MKAFTDKDDRSELIGQLIDSVEDFLSRNNGDDSNDTVIKGESYDALKQRFSETLENWGMLPKKNKEKDVIFLFMGPKDSGIAEFTEKLRDKGWNVITDTELDDTEMTGIDAIVSSPENYFDMVKDLKAKNIPSETVFFPPEHGENEDGDYIWSSTEEKEAFEPVLDDLTDSEDIAYDHILLLSKTEDLGKDRMENVILFIEQTRRVYRNFNRILDDMLEKDMISCKNGNKADIKIQNSDETVKYVTRQTLISNFIRQSNESAQTISQLLLYYMACCEI